MNTEKEVYSCYLGMRITPTMHTRLNKCAAAHNLPAAIFVRHLVLNELDKFEGAKPKKAKK